MTYRRISSRQLIDFLKINEPTLYTKYKDTDDTTFITMKEGRSSNDAENKKKTIHKMISKFAVHNGYHHGDVIEFIDDGFRNRGLLFMDLMKNKVIPPIYTHGEASLPEIFIVGDGLFSPNHWKGMGPIRPGKDLIKQIKTHFTKHTESLEVSINGNKYQVKREGDDWDNFNWTKMMLNPQGTSLILMDWLEAGGPSENETNLREFLKGDVVKQNATCKSDLEAKLNVAEKQLDEAQSEVNRLRKELEQL
jgi:hypothetical protein